MLRLLAFAILAMAFVVMPASVTTQYSDQARAETTATEKADTKATKKEKKAKKKKERTQKQKAAAERQKRCGAEYQEAKKAGKLPKGQTWRQFNRECLDRLKGGK